MLSFALEMCLRAFLSSVSAMGTSVLAIYSGIAVFVFILLRRLSRSGWTEMRASLKEALKDGGIALLVWWGGVFCYQLFFSIPHEITVQAQNIVSPRTPPKTWPKPSLPQGWDVKFMRPFCYVLFDTLRPQSVNGRSAFPMRIWSDVDRSWDGVAVRIRRPEVDQFLFAQELGTLRRGYSGSGTYLNLPFAPDFNQLYWVYILTSNENFKELLTITQANGHFEQQIQVYKLSGLPGRGPILLFDSVAQGQLP
jgi:hypothetical protein